MLFLDIYGLFFQFLQDFDFHKTLNGVLLLVFDDFHRVHRPCGQIYTLDDLTESALTQVLHNFILDTIWRRDDLVFLKNELPILPDFDFCLDRRGGSVLTLGRLDFRVSLVDVV